MDTSLPELRGAIERALHEFFIAVENNDEAVKHFNNIKKLLECAMERVDNTPASR